MPAESQSRLNAWNTQRARQTGINRQPLPANAQLKQAPNGRYVMSTANGRNYALSPDGKIRAYQYNGTSAAIDPSGRLQAVRSQNMLITHGPTGQRHVESRDAAGGYIYSSGPGRGFVERPVQVGGTTLIERTTVTDRSIVVTHYQSFQYQNVVLENYVPDTQYAPGFYLWLIRPWARSTPANTADAPAAYGTYFQPEATYNSPGAWMTDQVIASEMPEPAARQDAAAIDDPAPMSAFEELPRVSAPQMTPISRQEKAGLTQQFNQVIASDARGAQPGSQSGIASTPRTAAAAAPAALDMSIQYFFVDDSLDVKTVRGDGHCTLSKGDALHRAGPVTQGSEEADLLVESNMKGDCPSGAHVLVTIRDLQTMNNHCHESLSAAADKLANEEGKDGVPSGPPSGATQLAGLPPADLAAQGQKAKDAIANQETESAQLELATQQDIQTGLH